MANWIAGAIQHPGALHAQLHIPQGQPIPHKTLQHAAGQPGLLGQRARLAETLEHLPHRAMGGPMTPGHPYVVGEQGPEVVTPKRPGMVHPAQRSAQRSALLAHLGKMSKGAC